MLEAVFVRTHDGAKPETNIFRISRDHESGVNRFIPVSEIPKERTRLDHLSRRSYPIAWAEGGNYAATATNPESGTICYGKIIGGYCYF